jgi:SAM-dependent methyltransferase
MTTDERAKAGDDGSADEAAELFARRASSFGSAAAEYAAHRPGYPAQGVAWALAPAGEGPLHVLDLAAGTGKLSQAVAALGHRVTAVEPDAAMLAELRGQLPDVIALGGAAEEIPLPDASVDAVVVGQALHWFDQERALPEIARVLRPGGPFASLANADDDRVPWVAELDRAGLSPVRRSGRPNDPPRGIQPHPAFTPAEVADFPHDQRPTAESLVATVATHSHMLVMDPDARARVVDGMRAFLAAHPVTSAGEFDLPLVTRVQRCTRAGDRAGRTRD